MVKEYESIVNNNVSEVVPRAIEKLVLDSRWIFKEKHATYRSIEKYKAKILVKGYSQVEGNDYEETFEPVARYSSNQSFVWLQGWCGISTRWM